MKVRQYSVNEIGLEEIKEFLAGHHRLGGDHFDRAMLQAWASDAEFQMGEGNTASIEILSWDAKSGRTETYTISDSGIDYVEIGV